MTDLIDTHHEPSADPLTPLLIAPDTYVIQAIHGEGESPMAVHMNSMLIRGREPMVVDTGTPIDRDAYLRQLTSLVDPDDVRWIFVSHDDVDHYGNVDVLMDMCPNATMIATWFLTQRMSAEGPLPPMRGGAGWGMGSRWTSVTGRWSRCGRRCTTLRRPAACWTRPPASTGHPIASPPPCPMRTEYVDELDRDQWADGFAVFGKWNSPWIDLLDTETLRRRGGGAAANTRSPRSRPVMDPRSVTAMIDRVLRVDARAARPGVPEQPGQPVLEEMVTALEVHDRLK